MIARAVVLLAVTCGSAFATGICENTARHYDPPRLFSEVAGSFAITGHQDWCTELDDMQEQRGSVVFVELRKLDGSIDAILSNARGPQADRVTSLVGAFEAFTGSLATTLMKRGFAPLVEKSPRGCTAKVRWTAQPGATVSGFRASMMSVDIVRDGKRVTTIELELGATAREHEAAVRVTFRAKRAAIALFARVPSCSGGPPPGYFGPDDGGDCYEDDVVVIRALTVATTPALAGCFRTP